MAFGCASEIARAAASNSASCMPSATSASGVPFTVSGTDQTTFRAGLSLFQMPGTQFNLEKSVPCRLAVEVDAEHRRRRLPQPLFPALQGMFAADRPPIDERAGKFRRIRTGRAMRRWPRRGPRASRSRRAPQRRSPAVRTASLFVHASIQFSSPLQKRTPRTVRLCRNRTSAAAHARVGEGMRPVTLHCGPAASAISGPEKIGRARNGVFAMVTARGRRHPASVTCRKCGHTGQSRCAGNA